MDDPSQSPRSTVLQAFRAALGSDHPPEAALILELNEQGVLEQALHEMKRNRPRTKGEDPWQAFRLQMETEAARSRERRLHRWQFDPGRRTLRLRMAVARPACLLHPPALQAALAQALLEAGIPLAMGLEKTPRPMVRLGHPLPSGIEGRSEWADAVLREPSAMSFGQLLERINGHCPDGLRILSLEGIPNHASPVLDLCRKARWTWICPQELRAYAKERFTHFEAAASYGIAKQGKVAGQKQVKRIEVRQLVQEMAWEEDCFNFTTGLSAGEALNPVKLLAGILELETTAIQGLTRLSVELAEDPRLALAERYEPKLHNIFEDAVLLESGSNIQLIEDDEEAPIVLRRESRTP